MFRVLPHKSAAFFLLVIALCLSLQAQSEPVIHVTFVLTSPDLPTDTAVYITGSLEQLGTWNPGKVKMEPKGDHTWTKEISISGPVSIEYKYTLGTWEREGADANGTSAARRATSQAVSAIASGTSAARKSAWPRRKSRTSRRT